MPDKLVKELENPNSSFLVYTSAGKHSCADQWVGRNQCFDLWVTAYDQVSDAIRSAADYYHERKGGKFPNLFRDFQLWPQILKRYDAILVTDDDVRYSCSDIAELFRILVHYDLDVLQASFSQFGKVSHQITKTKLFSYFRYTNFIEVTCPLFRTEKLVNFLEVYDPVLIGLGVDYWFMQHLIGDRSDKAAVVDAVIALNPHDKTKGGREIQRLQKDELRWKIWHQIQESRQLHEINPKITWSTVRRFDKLRFYSSFVVTFFTKIVVRLKSLTKPAPSKTKSRAKKSSQSSGT